MRQLVPPSRGLRLQLAIFYLLLSVPALILIEQSVLAFEFQRCVDELDDGRTQRRLEAEAAALGAAMATGAASSELDQRLLRFVLELERPRQSLGTEAAYVLLELAEHPFQVQLIDQASAKALAPPAKDDFVRRRWLAAVPGSPLQLQLDMAVPSPWRHFGRRMSFEWPIAVSYLVLFLIGSAWFLRRRVLGRVERIGRTAHAWARGDFQPSINDPSRDELGHLARDLDRMAADLKALFATRSQLATLEERRRLARELHDTVKQKVFALSLQVGAAQHLHNDPQRLQSRLAESMTLVIEIQRELSDLLRELREGAGAVEDLVPALQRRLEDYSRRSGIAVHASLPEALTLAPAQVEHLLRIIDEALANAWRHARCSAVQLALAQAPGEWTLTIADDGVGGAAQHGAGMGLENMQARANLLPGGRFEIDSPVAGGTRLRIAFQREGT